MALAVRHEDVLPAGIAAELVSWLPRLPLGVETEAAGRGVWWGCEVEMPPITDPQVPPCVIALLRFLDREVPARVGRPITPLKRSRFAVRVWRKGSFVDDGAATAPGTVQAIVGLTGARWPAEWGGGYEIEGGPRWAPGWNTLDLVDGDARRRVALVTHHVVVTTVVATYGEPT